MNILQSAYKRASFFSLRQSVKEPGLFDEEPQSFSDPYFDTHASHIVRLRIYPGLTE